MRTYEDIAKEMLESRDVVRELTEERDTLRATVAKLTEERDAGLELIGSFFDALKPLELTHLNVTNPGRHVTDLIAERDQLRAQLAERHAGESMKQKSEAWSAVFRLVCDLMPWSCGQKTTGREQVLWAIRELVERESTLRAQLAEVREFVTHRPKCMYLKAKAIAIGEYVPRGPCDCGLDELLTTIDRAIAALSTAGEEP